MEDKGIEQIQTAYPVGLYTILEYTVMYWRDFVSMTDWISCTYAFASIPSSSILRPILHSTIFFGICPPMSANYFCTIGKGKCYTTKHITASNCSVCCFVAADHQLISQLTGCCTHCTPG